MVGYVKKYKDWAEDVQSVDCPQRVESVESVDSANTAFALNLLHSRGFLGSRQASGGGQLYGTSGAGSCPAS